MSLQWKLTFQKINFKNLIFIIIGIIFVVALISFSGDSCGIQHMQILNEIKSYEQSLDPEICEVIVEKIDLFNNDCNPQVEILDCG
jgi:hypothetical protein